MANIVGIACRLPGGLNDKWDYWEALEKKKVNITDAPKDRFPPDSTLPKTYKAGFLDSIKTFDNAFFRISSKEASSMDPQQRLSLEVAHEAIEDSGIDPEDLRGSRVGVYAGCEVMEYGQQRLRYSQPVHTHSAAGSALSAVSNRISFFNDWTGPSMTIATACSSSMSALHVAVSAIKAGECEVAVVVGANICSDLATFYVFDTGGFLSNVSESRPFDAGATGFVRAEALCAIVLQRSAGPRKFKFAAPYASIPFTMANEDGNTPSLTMPSHERQVELMKGIFQNVDKNNVVYVEAHGTGTPVGDPIEAHSIGVTFEDTGKVMKIGSVKGNLGHTEPAAGAVSVVKVALMMHKSTLLPSAGFDKLNPRIASLASRVKIQQEVEKLNLKHGVDYYMGVNCSGFGGANVHCIVQKVWHSQATEDWLSRGDSSIPAFVVVPLWSHFPAGLVAAQEAWMKVPASQVAGLAQLQREKRPLLNRPHHRRVLILKTEVGRIVEPNRKSFSLLHAVKGKSKPVLPLQESKRIAFVFNGQGSQTGDMAIEGVNHLPGFQSALEQFDRTYSGVSNGLSLIEDIGLGIRHLSQETLADTTIAVPCIVAVQVALTMTLKSFGIEASVVMGHSLGEMSAAWASGRLSLLQLAALTYRRASAQKEMSKNGRMAAIGCNVDSLEDLKLRLLPEFRGDVEVSAHNAPNMLTVSGTREAIEELQNEAKKSDLFFRVLDVERAYHSKQVNEVHDQVSQEMNRFHTQYGSSHDNAIVSDDKYLAMVSSTTGRLLAANETIPLSHWWLNMRQPVLFQEACNELEADLVIEIGARPVLRSYLNRNLKKASVAAAGTEVKTFWSGVAACFVAGVHVKWDHLNILDVPSFGCHLLPKTAWNHSKEIWFDTTASQRTAMATLPANSPSNNSEKGGRREGRLGHVTLTKACHGHYIFDHIIDASSVLPASLYIALALAMKPGSAVCELKTENFVAWPKDVEVKELGFHFDGTSFAYLNGDTTAARGRLASWEIIPPLNHQGLEGVRKYCNEAIDPSLMYRFWKEFSPPGFGPKFQSLADGFIGGNDVLAKLPPPPDNNHTIHPVVLDGALQSPLLRAGLTAEGYIPHSIELLQFAEGVERLPAEPVFVHVRLTHLDMLSFICDLDLYSGSGMHLFVARGYKTVRMRPTLHDIPRLYDVSWAPLPLFDETPFEGKRTISDVLSELSCAMTISPSSVVRVLCLDQDQTHRDQQTVLVSEIEASITMPWTLTVVGVPVTHGCVCGVTSIDKLARHSFTVVICKAADDANPYLAIGGAAFVSDTGLTVYSSEFDTKLPLLAVDEDTGLDWPMGTFVDLTDSEVFLCAPRSMIQVAATLKRLDAAPSSATLVCLVWKHDVQHDAVMGYCRSARNESPTRRQIYFVRLDGFCTPPSTSEAAHLRTLLKRLPSDDYDLSLSPDGQLSSLRIHPLELKTQASKGNHLRLHAQVPGQLRTLGFQRWDSSNESVGANEVRVDVLYAAINFKDVLLAMDMLPSMQSFALGNECVGRIVEMGSSSETQERMKKLGLKVGDTVVCIGGNGLDSRGGMLSTSAICSADFIFPIPENCKIPLHVFAGVSVVVCTAYYALVELAAVKAGDVVLIHSAMGGVGQAAMKLANRLGAKVIASAGSEAKRNALETLDYVIAVLDSHEPKSFYKAVQEATHGQGVDVVLNSLAACGITESLACVAPFGRFVEVGKRDMLGGRTTIPVSMFAENITFFSAHLDIMGYYQPHRLTALMEKVLQSVARGELDAVETHVLPFTQAKEAFHTMSRGQHTGKIVLAMPSISPQGISSTGTVEEEAIVSVRPEDIAFSLLPRGFAPFPLHLTTFMTGCAGGLGLFLAMAVARAGCKHMCLTTTRDPSSIKTVEMETAKKIWKDMNCNVKIIQVDLADAEAVDTIVKEASPPIGTVIHLANAYVDGPAIEISEKDAATALHSKAVSAWNLHESTVKHCGSLEAFLMMSSVSGLYGNLYQSAYAGANSALEELADLRREMDLPAVALDIPCVLGSGRSSQVANLNEIFWNSSRGFGIVSEMLVWTVMMEAFYQDRLKSCSPHLLLDNSSFSPYLDWSRSSLSFHHLCLDQSQGLTRVEGLDRQSLQQDLSERVQDLLGCSPEEVACSDTILADLGIDSLAAVELSNWFRAKTGVYVSQTEILTSASCSSLLDAVFGDEVCVLESDEALESTDKGSIGSKDPVQDSGIAEDCSGIRLSDEMPVTAKYEASSETSALSETESSDSLHVTPVLVENDS